MSTDQVVADPVTLRSAMKQHSRPTTPSPQTMVPSPPLLTSVLPRTTSTGSMTAIMTRPQTASSTYSSAVGAPLPSAMYNSSNHHHSPPMPNNIVSPGYTPKVRTSPSPLPLYPQPTNTPPTTTRYHSTRLRTLPHPCSPTPCMSSPPPTPATAPPASSSAPPAPTRAAARPSTGR